MKDRDAGLCITEEHDHASDKEWPTLAIGQEKLVPKFFGVHTHPFAEGDDHYHPEADGSGRVSSWKDLP